MAVRSFDKSWGDLVLEVAGDTLRGAKLARAQLQYAILVGQDLRDTDLWGANLQWADLEGARLDGADLRRADLHGANF
jgi:uncharacterized protein YjbI with pentapeptide repeats